MVGVGTDDDAGGLHRKRPYHRLDSGRYLSSAGGSHLHRPPHHAYPLDHHEGYGGSDPPNHRPLLLDQEGCCDCPPSVSIPPPRRHLRIRSRRRESHISHLPSQPTRSAQEERYRKHHYHRSPKDSSRRHSPHLTGSDNSRRHSPLLTRFEPLPSSKRNRLDKGSKSLPTPESYWDNGERRGCCYYGRMYDGRSKMDFKTRDCGHGCLTCQNGCLTCQNLLYPMKPPFPMVTEVSPCDDGYKSPSSPTCGYHGTFEVDTETRVDIGIEAPDESWKESCDAECNTLLDDLPYREITVDPMYLWTWKIITRRKRIGSLNLL